MKFKASDLWQHNITNVMGDISSEKLENFKRSPINFKISQFNPRTNGMRYLKTMLYNLVRHQTTEFWDMLGHIENRDVGNPIDVSINGKRICLDYYQAVMEIMFLKSYISMHKANILEIGAGYGRTCHSIMCNFDIGSYTIVDLEPCLQLSRMYLKRVLLQDEYRKVRFLSAQEFDEGVESDVDLTINIDSFAEMHPDVYIAYKRYIKEHSRYFYVKNPVGKYRDPPLDGDSQGIAVVEMALSTGPLREIVDIDDSREIENQVDKFLLAYNPGSSWKCVSHTQAPPWTYYWQAIYEVEKRDQE